MSGVPSGRVALAASMSEYVQLALAEAPGIGDPERQQALTDRFLLPALPALDVLFRELRAGVDPALRAVHAADASAKPYPIGLCLEITEAVRERLETVDPAGLSPAAAEGLAVLGAFRAAGGALRRAWGDLRSLYFQNALIVGALYVDVANDTVVREKPPVEILPFAASGFSPIVDHAHFARIAAAYWGCRLLPNHLLPEFAPYLPLVQITRAGRISLGPVNRYMLALTLDGGFASSERALAGPAMPPTAFASFGGALRDGPFVLPASPEAGRAAALAACRAYRAEGRADDADAYNQALAAARDANRRLERLVAVPRPEALAPA